MTLSATPPSPPSHAYLARLNTEQRQAVEHGIDAHGGNTPGAPAGPLLVIAGAGSGKTNTLAHRVAHLIAHGADPRGILLLTFSRRAAIEMGRRVERIVASIDGPASQLAGAALTWAGTFHSIGARLLREYAQQLGMSPSFTIHDREDSADLLNLVRHELGLSSKEKRFPAKHTCLSIYSRVINTSAALKHVLETAFPWCAEWEDELRRLFAGYVEAKQKQAVLDYDDLLLYWAQMLTEPALAESVGARFQHVLVDEYQDTNLLQAAILKALKPDGRGLTVVGDDAQSIYAFRGATVRNILDFPQQFDPPATIVTLERNYRSTPGILDASNAVIGRARERYSKELWTEKPAAGSPLLVTVRDEMDQAQYVVSQILERREEGTTLKKQAVLFRAAHHSAQIEIELTRRNVPFVKFGGLKFLEAAHIKDLLAVLRWIENPRDRVAGFRVLHLLPGIGPKTAGKVLDEISLSDEPLAIIEAFTPPAQAKSDWQLFVEMIRLTRGGNSRWPAEFELVRQWYEPHMERKHEDALARGGDLLQMEKIAAGYPTRERFLSELTLDPPDATSDESGVPLLDEDYLILSTIHSAKGQEWDNVFLLNAVDGCIPSDMATGNDEEIEEERRLLYVAMTRAKDQLQILTPQRFYVHGQSSTGDRHVYANCTRFIPAELIPHFETKAWPIASPPALNTPGTPPPQAFIDLAAKMREMWKA
ncbi:ATP-dependent helicase [Uliginosibacterium sp. H3]|uniref:DNA 3'-5' helicase n=1 Tax=Uliginosibacterium silvisoli TaxID=3114758 RepID=A0ABU6JZS7_9RHOO|nr:ATP-dependent helicase [Uliginosibacterium sp. H3]